METPESSELPDCEECCTGEGCVCAAMTLDEIAALRAAGNEVLDAFAQTGMEPESRHFKALVALSEALSHA